MSTPKIDWEIALVQLEGFIGHSQRTCLRWLCNSGEEQDFFRGRVAELASLIASMPRTYDQDGQGDNAIASLHYFTGGCDVWVTELDRGSPDDTPEDFQSQAFGLVDLGFGPDLGYVSLPEILAAGAELDLYYSPRTLAAIKAKTGVGNPDTAADLMAAQEVQP